MNEIRIYSRALSTTEIAEHYAGEYKNENGLVLHLPFSFDTDDYSAWGNDGTAYNDPDYVFDYSETFTLTWTQATDVFLETSDPDSVCTLSLDSARTNVDADTDTLEYIFSLNDATEGDCAIKVTSTDDYGLTDVDYYLAFTYMAWGGFGEILDSLFEYFGITDYIARISAYIDGLKTYWDTSLTNIVTLVTQQFSFINVAFGALSYWFGETLGLVLDFIQFCRDLMDGVSGYFAWMGNLWDWIGWNVWAPVLPLYIFLRWVMSIPGRADATQGGEMQVIINDFNTVASLISYFLGVFSFVVNTIYQFVMSLLGALT